MKKFDEQLRLNLIEESKNYYRDNRDPYSHKELTSVKKIVNALKRIFFSTPFIRIITGNNFLYRNILLGKMLKLNRYMPDLEKFYDLLEDEESKFLLIKLMSFRILGHVKVRLPLSKPEYWDGIKSMEQIAQNEKRIDLGYMPYRLLLHDLSKFNLPFKVYCDSKAVYTTYFLKQYEYSSGKVLVTPEKGDIVIDLGACFGDTALLFAEQVGETGKVFSFEFIPGNIEIIKRNLELNQNLKERVTIVDHPVWNESGKRIFFNDRGPGSVIRFEDFNESEGNATTLTIDDLVERNSIPHVDFIKTDIEGAEPFAIQGALKTISRFKPKLAISIYHSMDDFTGIVQYIDNLKLGYKFYIGHCTIFASETVLFAKVEN